MAIVEHQETLKNVVVHWKDYFGQQYVAKGLGTLSFTVSDGSFAGAFTLNVDTFPQRVYDLQSDVEPETHSHEPDQPETLPQDDPDLDGVDILG